MVINRPKKSDTWGKAMRTVLNQRFQRMQLLKYRTPNEKKSYVSKASFYEELEQVFFYHFSKYYMKTPFGDFNAKVERENVSKPTIGNKGLLKVVMIMMLE
jgi:hypothetical protein